MNPKYATIISKAAWAALVLAPLCLGTVDAAHAGPGDKKHENLLTGDDVTPEKLTAALASTRSIFVKPAVGLLITFDTNSTKLTQESERQLDIMAKALASEKLSSSRFTIEGHADPRGAKDANQRLSEGRADAVRQYLVEKHGIDMGRLSAVGKGDSDPYNKSNPAAAENRRVTFVAEKVKAPQKQE